jgi:hypothetical protein
LQFFEIGEVSNGEWIAQKLFFVQKHHPRRSLNHFHFMRITSVGCGKKVWFFAHHSQADTSHKGKKMQK